MVILTSNESGEKLAKLLGCDCTYGTIADKLKNDIVIRFGNTKKIKSKHIEINNTFGIEVAKDRRLFYQYMKKAKVRTPYCLNADSFPIYAYKNYSEGGKGIILLMSRHDLKTVRKNGIEISIFSRCVPIAREFRVHICKLTNKEFNYLTYEKIPRYFKHDTFIIRNSNINEYKFKRINNIPEINEMAKKALLGCTLDFAGIDIAIDDDDIIWVLDVNTAPGIVKQDTQDFYKESLKTYIDFLLKDDFLV
ncbi:hypothetical protein J7J62_03940 [bacterium]|nr:hypothetical protein [bacterium]